MLFVLSLPCDMNRYNCKCGKLCSTVSDREAYMPIVCYCPSFVCPLTIFFSSQFKGLTVVTVSSKCGEIRITVFWGNISCFGSSFIFSETVGPINFTFCIKILRDRPIRFFVVNLHNCILCNFSDFESTNLRTLGLIFMHGLPHSSHFVAFVGEKFHVYILEQILPSFLTNKMIVFAVKL